MHRVAEGKLRFLRFAAPDRDPGQRDPGILVRGTVLQMVDRFLKTGLRSITGGSGFEASAEMAFPGRLPASCNHLIHRRLRIRRKTS